MHYHLTVTWNSSTARRSGNVKAPQIRSILDDKGQDVTHLIDVNKVYPNLQSLQNEIAQKLGMESDVVILTESD
jgi:hypothetical protein